MEKIQTHFENEDEKLALVRSGDEAFAQRLGATVSAIAERGDLRIVTVSGPTCSGKTTASAKLEQALCQHGHRVHVISIDDFFLDRDFLLARAERLGRSLDFDSPDTLDFDALSLSVEQIFSGGTVTLPRFDFAEGKRRGYRRIETMPSDVYLFEGIQAVYPSVTSFFLGHPYASVYISVGVDAACPGASFAREDIRFLRRLVRDARFRAASPEFTFRLWETVRENELRNILPYADNADHSICSYLPYELHMIRPYAEELLSEIGRESRYFSEASRLCEMLSYVPPISDAYLQRDSLFREFLG